MALVPGRFVSAIFPLVAFCALAFLTSCTCTSDFDGLSSASSAEEAVEEATWPPGSVLELTKHNFSEAIGEHEYLLVDFYATWCEHCQKLAVELEIAAPLLAHGNPPVTVAKIDSEKYSAIAGEQYISRLPTLKLFVHGKPSAYNGPLEALLLVPAVQRLLAPPVLALSSDDEVRAYVERRKGGALGVFVGLGLTPAELEPVATNFLDRAWFATSPTFSEQLMVDLDFDKGPALLAIHSLGEIEVFYGPFEGKDLFQFVGQNYLPPIVLLTESTFSQVVSTGRPIVIMAANFDFQAPLNLGLDKPDPKDVDSPAGEAVRFTRRLKPVARRHRDKLFAYIDGARHRTFLESFHINVATDLPHFVVWNGGNEYYEDIDAKKYKVKYTKRQSIRETINGVITAPNFPLLLGVIAIALAVTFSKKGPSIIPSISGRGLEGLKEKLMEERRKREEDEARNGGGGEKEEEEEGQGETGGEEKEVEEKKND